MTRDVLFCAAPQILEQVEFQDLQVGNQPLYEYVAHQVVETWNTNNNCLLVVGATYPEEIRAVREIAGPEMIFLMPGIGAQGGDLEKAVTAGVNPSGTGIIVNSSRGIIYANNGEDFAEAAREAASKLRDEINMFRN